MCASAMTLISKSLIFHQRNAPIDRFCVTMEFRERTALDKRIEWPVNFARLEVIAHT